MKPAHTQSGGARAPDGAPAGGPGDKGNKELICTTPRKRSVCFGTFARRCCVRCVVSLQYQSSFCAKGMSYRTPTVLRCIRTTRARIPDEFRVCRLYPLEKLEKLDCGEMRASVQVLPYLTYSQLSTLPVQISVISRDARTRNVSTAARRVDPAKKARAAWKRRKPSRPRR